MEEVRKILDKASEEERGALAKILDAKTSEYEDIADRFHLNYEGFFGRLISSVIPHDAPSYSQVVEKVAEKLDIEHAGLNTKDLEVKIVQEVLGTVVWEEMTPEQKTQMEEEWCQTAEDYDEHLKYGVVYVALLRAQQEREALRARQERERARREKQERERAQQQEQAEQALRAQREQDRAQQQERERARWKKIITYNVIIVIVLILVVCLVLFY